MSKRGTSSVSSDGSDRGIHRGTEVFCTNSNRSQPRSSNPRGKGRRNARGGGGQNRGRNGSWRPERVEPRNDLNFPPGQNNHHLQYVHGDLNNTMIPFPTQTLPPRPPLIPPPMLYGIPPLNTIIGSNPAPSGDGNQVQNQAGPSHTRKRPVKKQANTSHAPNTTAKISQKKNAHKNKNVIVNTPSQNAENPQPQNNTNLKNKIKDPPQISTKDHVRSDSKTKSTLENERSETQSSLENLQITDTDPLQLQDSKSDEVSDNIRTVYKDDDLRPPIKVGKTLKLINQSEAKDALVPMNFGIELLDSVTHNNIELVADQGAKIRANSAILSLNSPVIHHMTTTLELLTIDMEEFSEQSVRYFVEAAYTGKLPTVSGEMFRDLNKISHAFKVTWLQNSCYKMFSEFTAGIPDILPPYQDLLFVFEEAAYVLSKLKKRDFLRVALGKITTSNSKRFFITKYLAGIETLSDYHLDMVVELAEAEVDLILLPLREQFVKQLGVEKTVISNECKYLLEHCHLSLCSRYSPDLFQQIFDFLEKLAEESTEDMKWVLQLHRKSAGQFGVARCAPVILDENSNKNEEDDLEKTTNSPKPKSSCKTQ